jgi:hypothetical protein
VTLDAERKLPEDDAGFYSLDGVDCGYEVELCVPLPDLPERHAIAPVQQRVPDPRATNRR